MPFYFRKECPLNSGYLSNVTDAISLDTWKKTVKRFYDTLVVQFDIEEAWAEQQLKKVTR
ncbi:antitermination protein [Escherichia coli]|nr:antitermination protein [Escherichia coli]